MDNGNFQHFLKVLEEVEDQKPKERTETRLRSIPEKCSIDSLEQETEKLPPILNIKTIKSKSKPMRYSLRRPGFIYRTKDLSKTTFLDNNLWEFTCGRRVLKAPSFKYRHRQKSNLSPYSAKILASFNKLTLKNSTMPVDPCHSRTVDKQPLTDRQSPMASSKDRTQFIPLSRCPGSLPKLGQQPYPKRAKHVISPSKLCSNIAKEPPTNCANRRTGFEKYSTKTFGWSAAIDTPTFSELSAQLEPLAVRKIISRPCNEPTNPWYTSKDTTPTSHADSTQNPHPSSAPRSGSPTKRAPGLERSCSFQARMCEQDMSVDELSLYMEDSLFLPQKMSSMAEMMYT